MPKYIVNGKTYNIPDDKVEGFERKYPDANVEYNNDGKTYHIPINKREGFLKQYPNAVAGSFDQPTQPTQQESAPITTPQPNEEEYIKGFGAGVKQGTQQLGAGLKYAGGEALDLVSQTAKDNADALAALEQMQAEGKDVAEETKTDAKSILLPLLGHSSPAIDMVSRLFGKKNPIANANAEVATDRTIRRALKETNGDVEAAKALLAERANEQTTADIWKEEAAQKMNEAKPTKGFGAWVGNMVPQMAGTLAGLGLSAVTKSPVPAQVLGLGQMGALTASTAGASMKEARDAGATNGEVWATGLADAAVELATEAIPFKRYISPLVNQARTKVAKEMVDAVLDGKSPARNELQELLTKANEQLGGKLFSKKNVWDYIEDVGAEGLSEFAAEALQTITPMIYAEPENYPTLWEVVNNGVEGLKGGIFMGAVLGGASNAATNKAQRDRRKQQGFVDVAEVKFSEEQNDTGVAEVLSYDPKTNQASVLFDGEIIPIDNASENIINSHRFTFDEFDRGQIDMEQAESYENGRNFETPQEKNDAYNMYEYQAQNMRRIFGLDEDADVDAFIGDDPLGFAMQRRNENPDDGQAVLDYLNAKATRDGMLDATNDKIDEAIAQSNATIDRRKSQTNGLIHPAILKGANAEKDRRVYIISGQVSTLEGSRDIDTEKSDKTIIVEDAETGKKEFIEPSALLSIDEALDPEQEKAAAAEVISNTISEQAEREIEGTLPFNVGESYTILDTEGAQHTVTILADTQDGNVQVSLDNAQEVVVMPKEQIQQMSEAYNIGRTASVVEAKKAMEQSVAPAEQVAGQTAPAPRIPLNELGEPMYEQAPVYDTWVELVELNEGNEDEAIDTANIMRDNAQAELDKAMKTIKVQGKTVPEIQAAKAEQKALIKQAQDKLNYWTDVANYRDAQIELMKRAGQRATIAKAQAASQEKGRYSEENAALGAPIDFRDYVMRAIATGGIRFIWKDSATGTRGLGSHTGLKSNEERNARIWLLNNENGLYPEEAAEQLLTSYAEELGYTPNIDTMDALSEILDVVGSYATPSSMFEAAQLRHADLEAETAAQDEADAQARVLTPIAESLGLTLDEYLAWEEMMYAETLPAFEADYEQIIAIFVDAAQQEEILNQNNDERSTENADVQSSVHSEGGLSDGSQAGVGVLQGTQVDNGIADSRGTKAGQGSDTQTIDAGTNDISTSEVSERADLADFPRADKATQERFREERAKFFTSDSEYAQVLKGASTVEDALVEFWRRAERAKQRDDKNGVERYESFASVLAKRVKYTEAENNTSMRVSPLAKREEMRRKPLRARAKMWEAKVGVPVHLIETFEEVPTEDARKAILDGKTVTAWVTDGEVYLYIPYLRNRTEVDKTYIHEVVAHLGMKRLLGKEGYRQFCMRVYNEVMTEADRELYDAYPNVKNHAQAADEYIAHLSEDTDMESSIWQKVVRIFRDALRVLGIETALTNKDIQDMLRDSYRNLVEENVTISESEGTQLRSVYHGSGSDFNKFDHSFMGTGEGSQSFGWGTYVTEDENSARAYAQIHPLFYNKRLELSKLRREQSKISENIPFLKGKALKKATGELEKIKRALTSLSNEANRYLYSVEIPDDNGKNYIHWDKNVPSRIFEKLTNILPIKDVSYWLPDHIKDSSLANKIAYWMQEGYPKEWKSWGAFYKALSNVLGSDKAASEFLNENGYVGISYPPDGGNAGKAKNYVIFNESDLEIKDSTRFRVKEKAPETASVQKEHQPTVVSSADGTKVLKKIDSAIEEYENKSNYPRTLLGDIAKVLNARKQGSNSQYATFEAKNGKVFTIRLADHNAKVSTFDIHNEKDGISIIITAKSNEGVQNDGDAHIVEYFYDSIKLRKADGKPLVEILKSIKQALYSGEYKDTTGLAEREEVNIRDGVRFRVVEPAPTFYSNAERAAENVKQEKATPEQWLKMIEKNGGLKAGEDKWLGLSDWLKSSDKKALTKQEVLDFIKENQIQIEEVEYGQVEWVGENEIYESEEFADLLNILTEYEEDNGEEYPYIDKVKFQELRNSDEDFVDGFDIDYWGESIKIKDPRAAARYLGLTNGGVKNINGTRIQYTTDGLDNKREIALTVPTIESWNELDEIHFGDAGNGRAIAWVRFGETTDADGNRVLVIDEVQSKRHQEGREKGYAKTEANDAFVAYRDQMMDKYGIEDIGSIYGVLNTEDKIEFDKLRAAANVEFRNSSDIPSAPFEKNWAELAMKRMLRYAAENGFDKIAWTTGDQQAERYDISKSVDNIKSEDNNVEETADGTLIVKNITIYAGGSVHNLFVDANGIVRGREYDGKKLSDIVGKPLAQKLMEQGDFELEGDGLRIGGEGMKAFYDQMIPSFMNKYGKKWGVKVGEVTMPSLEKNNTMHSVDVTDAMRESVMQGQPMFRITDYNRQFADLQAEYDALDKNDADALNEWREKKTSVVRDYLSHIKDRFGMRGELIVFNGANEEQIQQSYQQLIASYEVNGNTNPPTYEAFKEKSLRKNVVGTYRKGGNAITFNATADDAQNRKMQFAETMFHENAHRVSDNLYSDKEFESIWAGAKKSKDSITKMVNELYESRSDVAKGKEYIAKAVGYLANKQKDSFMQFLRDEMPVEELLKKLRSKSEIAKLAVEETLNIIKDEYRVQLSRRGNTRGVGGVGYGSDLRDSGMVLQGDGRAEQGRRTDNAERGLRGRVLTAATGLAASLGVKLNIIEDVNDITDRNARQQRAKRGAKAWYDVTTGQVYFVLPNATSVEDAVQTVLHEVVAHKGLRDVVGREHFEEFLGKVFRAADTDTRRKIVALAAQNGWDFNVATEEYLASLAEEGFDSRENRAFLQKVRDLFMDMLRAAKIVLGFNINDNDMRYMLWRTYQMQRRQGAMAVAEDVVVQHKLGVGNYRYRSVKPSTPSTGEARHLYDDAVRRYNKDNNIKKTENLWHHLREGYQDSMLSVQKLMEAVLTETGNTLRSSDDVYKAENQLSSKNKAEIEKWERDFMKPLQMEILNLVKKGASYDDIVEYLMAKHGLERNLEFSRREDEENGKEWDGSVKRDYSGLTELTGEAEHFTEAAQQIVDEFEGKYNTDNLWSKINAATKESLRKSYDSGLMSKETYDKVSTMFKYYVPLRGWDSNVAADQYEYMGNKGMKILPVLKTAKGRTSRADDPIATLGSVGESSIIQGNRNLMKLKFLNFAQNNPTSLLTVSEQWYEQNADGTWKPSNPEIPENASADEVDALIKEHEAKMEALGDKATKKRQGLNINLHTTKWEQEEHAVNVKRNGKEYKIFVNGNPIAAQAINGFTNPNANKKDSWEWIEQRATAVKNFMARAFTSMNPAFIFTNLARDLVWAGTSVAIKENAAYARQYTKNISEAMIKAQLPRLVSKWKNGTLDMNVPVEKYFNEFVANGGETGFTQLNTVDDYKRNMERFIKEAQGGTATRFKKGWRWIWDNVEFLNRSAEDTTRFMVYLTSRQMGRSITESVANAKDITVNFNKKGRGTMGANVLGFAYIFFNATIQSLANFGKLIANHPKKTTAALTTFASSGMIAPMVALAVQAMLSGDDDEPTYWDLPEWVRRNNIVIYVGGSGYVTIPLPHELRPFYGMGELAFSTLMGKEEPEVALQKAVEGFASLMPFDFTGNGGNVIVNFIPTIAQPLVQLVVNKDYFGTPIYRKTEFNTLDPEWTKAYKSTNQLLVDATEFLNELTGGDEVKNGLIDLNPAVIEHLYEGYLGGMAKTINRTAKTLSMLWDEDARTWRNVPVLSSFYNEADERTSGSQVNREYFAATDEADEVEHLYSGYKKRAKMGSMEYAEKLNELENSDVFKRYQTVNSYQKAVSKLNTALKDADNTDREEIETLIMELKVDMLEELDAMDNK